MKLVLGVALATLVGAVSNIGATAPPVLVIPKSASPYAAGPVDSDLLFSQGAFEQARAAYQSVPKSSPRYEEALRQLGAIALLQNHLGEAETMLNSAHARNPADRKCMELLAETLHRADRFAETAALLRQLGRPERAAEFELFGKNPPYRLQSRAGTATIELQWTEPFPVARATVNGLDGLFLIDTGAPEIVLDPEFANAAHVALAAPNVSTESAGRAPAVPFGRIAKFVLPGLETDNVPAMVVSTKGLSPSARNKRIAGVIGTQFLSHFRATLDYVHNRLILEPRDSAPHAGGTIAQIPFWFFGDHILLAPGRLNQGPKQLFFINTGMSGYAFMGPQSTLKDAGIEPPAQDAARPSEMSRPQTATFPIAQLSLGNLTEKNVNGLYGLFPPPLENGLGIHVGGIVSHAFFHNYAVTFDFVAMKIGIRT